MDIPFLNKLNTKVEPTLDISNNRLYDKGENIYIPLDGTLTAHQYTLLPGQAFTQMGLQNQSFYTLTKQSYNDRVIIIKVHSIWPHLPQNVKEDLHYIQVLTTNPLLSQYQQLPTLLYPYLTCIRVSAKQKVFLDDTIIFISEGGLLQHGKEVHNQFEGEAIALTDCRLYALQKTSIDIQYIPLFGHCEVNITSQKLMLKSAVLQFDSPKYAHSSVIKDIKIIKQLLKGEDYSQLRHKIKEVFGRKSVIEPGPNIHQLSASVRQRTISCQEDNGQPRKPLFRRVHIPRQVMREPRRQETTNWCIQKINYTPVPNRQSRVKMNTSNSSGQKEIPKEQPKPQQQQYQQQCLPIIKSFVSPEDFQQYQQFINRKPTQHKKKILNKFIEFDKIMNQLMK